MCVDQDNIGKCPADISAIVEVRALDRHALRYDMTLIDHGPYQCPPDDDEGQWRTGVLIGSGIGGLEEISKTALLVEGEGKVRRVSPFFIPASLINLVSGHVSIKYGFKGPNHAVVTACSTGANAIGDATRIIMWDDADVMVAGGTEAAVCRLGVAGFCAARALSTNFNDTPGQASRPWDQDRDGFVMGDGAGVVVLEELEHAKKRGAIIYGEVVGYGMSGDAHHITAPAEDGDGAYRCMRAALQRAHMEPGDIDYVNAHGTSTPLNDKFETMAMKTVFGEYAYQVNISSTKSMTGHLLGASGALEAVVSVMAIENDTIPPTINLEQPDPECDLNYTPNKKLDKRINTSMNNSFGFGGHNASLIFQKVS